MLAPSCNVGVNVKNETDAGTRGEKNQLYTVSTVPLSVSTIDCRDAVEIESISSHSVAR